MDSLLNSWVVVDRRPGDSFGGSVQDSVVKKWTQLKGRDRDERGTAAIFEGALQEAGSGCGWMAGQDFVY